MKLGAFGVAAAGVLLVGGALAGCSSSSSGGSSASPTSPSSATGTSGSTAGAGYTKETEGIFVEACVSAAQTNGTSEADARAICGCTYRGIAKTIPYEQYVKADEDAAKGSPVPTQFTDIRDECNRDPNVY